MNRRDKLLKTNVPLPWIVISIIFIAALIVIVLMNTGCIKDDERQPELSRELCFYENFFEDDPYFQLVFELRGLNEDNSFKQSTGGDQ